MSAADYYDDYWSRGAASVAGWTPSAGVVTPEERALFAQWIPRGAVCLDYGCGDGRRCGLVLRELGARQRGFDVSAAAVESARAVGVEAELLDSAGRSSLADGSVEAAVCLEVLEHLQEPQRALAEIRRCLKPGGHAILSVPNAAFWTQRLEFLLTGFWCPGGSPDTARREPWRDPHLRFFNPRLLRRMVEEAGFVVAAERGEAFTLGALPGVWRRPRCRAVADRVSRPLGWMGRVWPSWFAARLFLVARKPADAAI